MTSRRLWAALLVTLMVATACGGDDGAEPSSNIENAQTESGSASGGGGEGGGGEPSGSGGGFTADDARAEAEGAGADFPIPIPGGWEFDNLAALVEAGASGFSGGVQLLYARGDFDELVAYYDEWTEAQSGYIRGATADSVTYTKTSPLSQISISRDFEDLGELWTALTVSVLDE